MTNRQRQPKEPHTSAHSGTWVAAALHCIVCLNEQVQSRSVQGQSIQYLWRRSTCHWPSVLPGSAPRALFPKRLLTSQSPAQAGVCRAVVSRYSMGLCLASKQTGENKWGFFLESAKFVNTRSNSTQHAETYFKKELLLRKHRTAAFSYPSVIQRRQRERPKICGRAR